jgi:hypothetical protein
MNASPLAAAWSLATERASCTAGGMSSVIDLAVPQSGLAVVRPGAAEPDRLLGVELDPACACADAWCRGSDVTAMYETRDGGRLRATAMWRAQPAWLDATVGAWCREVIVSAQTALLESMPQISVSADVAGDSVVPVAYRAGRLEFSLTRDQEPHGFLVSGPGDLAVVFLVHPVDARGATARADAGRVHIAARLFPTAVEKGVLLRSRVIAAIGPARDATAPGSWLPTLATAFATSPPVLTT